MDQSDPLWQLLSYHIFAVIQLILLILYGGLYYFLDFTDAIDYTFGKWWEYYMLGAPVLGVAAEIAVVDTASALSIYTDYDMSIITQASLWTNLGVVVSANIANIPLVAAHFIWTLVDWVISQFVLFGTLINPHALLAQILFFGSIIIPAIMDLVGVFMLFLMSDVTINYIWDIIVQIFTDPFSIFQGLNTTTQGPFQVLINSIGWIIGADVIGAIIDEIRKDFWFLFAIEAFLFVFGYLLIWLKNQFFTFLPVRDLFHEQYIPIRLIYNFIVIATNAVDSIVNTIGTNIATLMTLQGEFWTIFLIYVWIRNRPDEEQTLPEDFTQKLFYQIVSLFSLDDFEMKDFDNVKKVLKPVVLLLLMPATQGVIWFFQGTFWAKFIDTMEGLREIDFSALEQLQA